MKWLGRTGNSFQTLLVFRRRVLAGACQGHQWSYWGLAFLIAIITWFWWFGMWLFSLRQKKVWSGFLYIHLGRIVIGKKFPNIATLTTYTKKKNIESIYEYKANEVITNLQEPVNGKKQTDVFDRKACSCKNQEHSDETCTGYAGSSNTR